MFTSPQYPYDSQFHVQSDGHRMHYLDEGSAAAQPVVMVHGNPTWSFYYRRVVDALKGEFRCLVPDHIGMGLSDRPSDEHYVYTLQSRLDDFGHWLDAVEPERPDRSDRARLGWGDWIVLGRAPSRADSADRDSEHLGVQYPEATKACRAR